MTANAKVRALLPAVETFEPVVLFVLEWQNIDGTWSVYTDSSSEADMRESLRHKRAAPAAKHHWRILKLVTVQEVIE